MEFAAARIAECMVRAVPLRPNVTSRYVVHLKIEAFEVEVNARFLCNGHADSRPLRRLIPEGASSTQSGTPETLRLFLRSPSSISVVKKNRLDSAGRHNRDASHVGPRWVAYHTKNQGNEVPIPSRPAVFEHRLPVAEAALLRRPSIRICQSRRSANPDYHIKMGRWGRMGRMGQIISPTKSTS